MKSFFKKLSLVLAAAMVITMIPAGSVKAAGTMKIYVDGNKEATLGKDYTLEKGDTADLKFDGATGYKFATDGASKKWTSSDANIVSVENGKITAVNYGTATITVACTVSATKTDYVGSMKVTVPAPATATPAPATDLGYKIKQTAYNAVEITFADNEAAKAAKITTYRAVNTSKGEMTIKAPAAQSVNKNVVTVSQLSNGVTYKFEIEGKESSYVTMSVGEPVVIDLSYGTVYIGTGKDIYGTSIKNPIAKPTVKVLDVEGVAVDTSKTGSKITYTRSNSANVQASVDSQGKITFKGVNASAYVKVTYTWKDAAGGTKSLDADGTFYPTQYVEPSLGGFVTAITVTTEKAPKNVKYDEGVYNCTLNVGDTGNIAYYFTVIDPDGTEHKVTSNANSSVSAYSNASGEIKVLNSDRKFYLALETEDSKVISLNGNKVIALSDGIETVCLYEMAGKQANTATDTLYGVLEIEVRESAKATNLEITSDSYFDGTVGHNIDDYKTGTLTYKITDQYGEKFKSEVEVLRVTDNGTTLATDGIKIGDTSAEGKVTITYADINKGEATSDGSFDYIIRLKKNPEEVQYFSVNVTKIDKSSDNIGYEIITKTTGINNKSLWDKYAAANVGTTIKAVKTIDGLAYEYVDFAVIADNDLDALKTWYASTEGKNAYEATKGKNFVIITDGSGVAVSETKGTEIKTASNLGEAAAAKILYVASTVKSSNGKNAYMEKLGTDGKTPMDESVKPLDKDTSVYSSNKATDEALSLLDSKLITLYDDQNDLRKFFYVDDVKTILNKGAEYDAYQKGTLFFSTATLEATIAKLAANTYNGKPFAKDAKSIVILDKDGKVLVASKMNDSSQGLDQKVNQGGVAKQIYPTLSDVNKGNTSLSGKVYFLGTTEILSQIKIGAKESDLSTQLKGATPVTITFNPFACVEAAGGLNDLWTKAQERGAELLVASTTANAAVLAAKTYSDHDTTPDSSTGACVTVDGKDCAKTHDLNRCPSFTYVNELFNGVGADYKLVGEAQGTYAKVYTFDTLNENGDKEEKAAALSTQMLDGTYTATLYNVNTSDTSLVWIADTEFTVESGIKGLTNIQQYKLKINNEKVVSDLDSNGKTQAAWTKDSGDYKSGYGDATTAKDAAVSAIFNSFYAWFDANNDGKAIDTEVGTIKNVIKNISGATLAITNYEAVVGADGKTIYIKYIDYKITFENTKLIYEGTYDVNAKFVTGGIYQ